MRIALPLGRLGRIRRHQQLRHRRKFREGGRGPRLPQRPPNRGVYRGNASETIDVAVKSEELPVIPPELAAERMQSLEIPSFATGAAALRELAEQQEVQQQQ